jgi:Double zinc ribbon
MQIALFGIDNDALNLTVNLLVVLLVVVWLALVAWTYFDARRRLEDPVLIGCAVVASLFPFVGTIVYTILRPPEFIEDRKERELEIRAAELRVRQLTEQSCPNCGHPVEKNYLRCPDCQSRIKDPCPSCEKPIDPRWAMCPYCETPIHREQPRRKSQERRPRRSPERTQSDRPQRSTPAASKRSAPKREPASPPKREPASASAPSRRKPASSSSRRASGSRAKSSQPPPDPNATQEHPAPPPPTDGSGEKRSRRTPAS